MTELVNVRAQPIRVNVDLKGKFVPVSHIRGLA
jgi:hypothetical protein